jgi:exonuclease VII large subunit
MTATALEQEAQNQIRPQISHDEITKLAHALWVARGGQGGSPEEDWLRAEEILVRSQS